MCRYGLIKVAARPRPFAALSVDPVVLARLRAQPIDFGSAAATDVRTSDRAIAELLLPAELLLSALRYLSREPGSDRHARVALRGRMGTGRRTLLASLAAKAGRDVAIIDATRLPRKLEDFADALRTELTRALLRRLIPCVTRLEDLSFEERTWHELVKDVLRAHPGPLAVRLPAGAQVPFDPGHLVLDLPTPGEGHRLSVWQEALGTYGYSRQMLRSTAELAGDIGNLEEVQSLLVRGASPVMEPIDGAIATRQDDVRRMQAWIDNESGFFGHHQSLVHAQRAHEWVNGHMGTLIQDRDNIQGKFQSYNSWVPQANAFYSSATRLTAQLNMLGVGSNLHGMVEAVLRELGVPAAAAPAEGQAAQPATGAHAIGARAVDAGAPLPVPPTDDTVTQAGMEATGAFRRMQTAYIGLQQNFHSQRIQEVHAQGDSARARLQEINDIKQFIHQVGATIDTTAAVVNGAPAAISNATEFMGRTGARYGAMRNRRAMMQGEAARWNPTYTTVNAEGQMVIRNMQTGIDVNPMVAPGEDGRRTPSPTASDTRSRCRRASVALSTRSRTSPSLPRWHRSISSFTRSKRDARRSVWRVNSSRRLVAFAPTRTR